MDTPPARKSRWNLRKRTLTTICIALLLLFLIVVSGIIKDTGNITVHLDIRNNAPTFAHLFGTDWLGRDMFTRTLKGLTLSLSVGVLAAFLSAVFALFLSLLASWNKKVDYIVVLCIDIFMSVPHLISLLLISFAIGGGVKGVVIGIALTHWPSLTRVLRAEMLQIQTAEYVTISRRLGKSRWWVAWHHFLPHLLPQLVVGFILLFPHAILHEAAITFLGFGLSPEQPAIGIILSESMRYLTTGKWWLAFFPGLSLVIMVGIFDVLGNNIRRLIDPFHAQR